MATTASYLVAPVNRAAEAFFVSSLGGAVVGGYIRVDDEFSIITELQGQVVTVRSRGSFGGAACAHPARAPVTFGKLQDLLTNAPATDTPDTVAGGFYAQRSLSVGGALDLCDLVENTEFRVVAPTSLDVVLKTAPRLEQEGLRARFVNNTALAHTIRNPFLAAPNDAALVGALIGATVEYQAVRGLWAAVHVHRTQIGDPPVVAGTLPPVGSEGSVLTSVGGLWQPAPTIRELPQSAPVGTVLTWNGTAWVPQVTTPTTFGWVHVPFNAADFTAVGGTWTVLPSAVLDFSYLMLGPTAMLLSVNIAGLVSLDNSMVTEGTQRLRIAIPGGRTIASGDWKLAAVGRLYNGGSIAIPASPRELTAAVSANYQTPTVIDVVPIRMTEEVTVERSSGLTQGQVHVSFQIMLELNP